MRAATAKIFVSLAGALALFLCFTMMSEVPRNTKISNPQPSLTILWTLAALIIAAGALALIRSSRMVVLASFVASGLGILFSLMLACI
jgi:hypothetical protein